MGLPRSNRESLSEDMLVEILTRLPLKSFSRSKCVSKTWQSLLSNDYVRNKLPLIVSGVFRHPGSTLRSGPTYATISDANSESKDDLDFFPFRSDSTLLDCSNGLLLFYSPLTATFRVCNPTTNKYVSLPKSYKETKLSVLAFDPYHSRHFKVVSFTGLLDEGADLELFDSESGNWVEHRVHWGIDTNAVSSKMRYTDGVLYVLAQPKHVVAVDLDDMISCSLIELPETMKKDCYIGKVGGRLHYSVNDGDQLRIWMLRENQMGWSLKHSVSDDQMDGIRVLALHPERDVVYVWAKEKLVAYDVCEKSVEEAWELRKEEKGHLVGVWVFPFSKYLEDCLASS